MPMTLPASICEAAQLEIGDFIDVRLDGETITLHPKKLVDKNQAQSEVVPNEEKIGLAKIYGMVKKGEHPSDYSVRHDKYLAEALTNVKSKEKT